ncbi:hypothetical protein [uncultured Roseobacter sp.]|uniref:hypothetical protein n=1 Tax=uncultured Roseobacter sp. TaxID=114847 RepID=UPI0026219A62|nr:hypothetical protein [uncultured Roseobacter sp.]
MTQEGKRAILTRSAALALLLSAAAPIVLAEDRVRVPNACTAVATVHKNSCVTTSIMQCANSSWQALTFRRGKPLGTTHYDRDWAFVKWETHDANSLTMEHVPGSGISMNIRDLMDIGYHEAQGEFVLTTNIIDGQPYVLSGRTEYSGANVTVGDEEFLVFKADRLFEREAGAGGLAFNVDVLVSLSRELVIEGKWSRRVLDGDEEVLDYTPQAIYERGDPGFLATTSEFGCE